MKMIIGPSALLLLSVCCVALFYILIATQHSGTVITCLNHFMFGDFFMPFAVLKNLLIKVFSIFVKTLPLCSIKL